MERKTTMLDKNDIDVTPNDNPEKLRHFQEFLDNLDHDVSFKRYRAKIEVELAARIEEHLAELKRRRDIVVQLLGRDAGDYDDSFSLDGRLIHCPGNVAFHCMVGYHKDSLSTCPFCDSLMNSIQGLLTSGVSDDAKEDEDVGGNV